MNDSGPLQIEDIGGLCPVTVTGATQCGVCEAPVTDTDLGCAWGLLRGGCALCGPCFVAHECPEHKAGEAPGPVQPGPGVTVYQDCHLKLRKLPHR